MKHNIKKLAKAQLEIEIEIGPEELKKYIDKAISHIAEHIDVAGFRKGKAPKEIVEEKAGKETVLAEAADLAINELYNQVISENKLEPIEKPQAEIVKLAEGNPFIFKVKTTVLPDLALPDYKKLASEIKINEVLASQEELEDTLKYIQKSRAKFSQIDRPCQEKDFVEIEYSSPELQEKGHEGHDHKTKDQFILGEGGMVPGFEKNIVGMKAGEGKEFSVDFPKNFQRKDLAGKKANFKVKMISAQKVELPEINDEFAKTLGKFENLEAFKVNVKEGITQEKTLQEKDKRRQEVLEKISAEIKTEVPEALITFEQNRMMENFKHKISHDFNLTFEQYLATIKQDEKTVRDSFLKESQKKAMEFLVLRELGKAEKVSVSDEEADEETNKMIKNYPVDTLKKVDINGLKEYIKGVIFNEKIFQMLEKFFQKS